MLLEALFGGRLELTQVTRQLDATWRVSGRHVPAQAQRILGPVVAQLACEQDAAVLHTHVQFEIALDAAAELTLRTAVLKTQMLAVNVDLESGPRGRLVRAHVAGVPQFLVHNSLQNRNLL
jgi:hypothetical protein